MSRSGPSSVVVTHGPLLHNETTQGAEHNISITKMFHMLEVSVQTMTKQQACGLGLKHQQSPQEQNGLVVLTLLSWEIIIYQPILLSYQDIS
jgi:hypothetical protein